MNLPNRSTICLALSILLAPMIVVTTAMAQSELPTEVNLDEVVADALTYLKETGQADDGSFSGFAGTGVTSLVATAMLRHGVPADDPSVALALEYLADAVQSSGGIHADDSLYKNYETSLALLCFAEANSNGQYDTLIADAESFLKGGQWTEQRGIESEDGRYGGFGYGKHERPDLSNVSFTIEALVDGAGNDADSEAIQRALKFVTRSQNHESSHNSMPFAAKNPDGGFFYTPSGEGESKAGETANGGLRSYASMTYAGLKSMLYAGVDKDDTRVRAAVDWLSMNYDLKSNPGMGTDGLFYYYHVFAKALNALGEDEFVDGEGVVHNWRAELVEELASRQLEDGSWVNENARWMEGDPNLVTGYALLALAYCQDQ
ncbi:MAG: hypothetical protein ACR2NP_19985 [Pirellulaceae bacterium]